MPSQSAPVLIAMDWPCGLAPWPVSVIGMPQTSQAWAIFLGIVFAGIAISLLVASWTRWGQSKALAKCVGIALLAHIWLLLYAYGTRIVSPGYGPGANGGIATEASAPAIVAWESSSIDSGETDSDDFDARSADSPTSDSRSSDSTDKLATWSAEPWEMPFAPPRSEQVDAPKLPKGIESLTEIPREAEAHADALIELPTDYSEEELLRLAELPIDPSLPALRSVPSELAGPTPENEESQKTRDAMERIASTPAATPSSAPSAKSRRAVPHTYQMRMSPDRARFAASNGGDASTETAVQNALAWLARNQAPDGSWNAQAHGAGSDARNHPASSEGRYRANAGQRADTAMTGLAILAFLGAGHTHDDGPYATHVARGLRYLIDQQFPSGDLSGRQQIGQEPTVRYARMYSHGMASLAIAEAYAMSGDPMLLPPLRSAAGYTIKAMNPRTGGWRYDFASDDPGDTSQFGWQAMVLHSAGSSGAVALPGSLRIAFQRFLESVSTGRFGGLAVYRNVAPGSIAPVSAATPAMTAEAMAMRHLLELPIPSQAAAETRDMLLASLPGRSEENLYYWYYASMALYQSRAASMGSHASPQDTPAERAWVQWNNAMKQQLCGTQVVEGINAGSWNPTCVWGSYGGRVYSTATACMCMEVYYRYLPMYQEPAIASPSAMWNDAPRR